MTEHTAHSLMMSRIQYFFLLNISKLTLMKICLNPKLFVGLIRLESKSFLLNHLRRKIQASDSGN